MCLLWELLKHWQTTQSNDNLNKSSSTCSLCSNDCFCITAHFLDGSVYMGAYLSQGSWACDHLGCYWLLSQQVWAVCMCLCVHVCVCDLPEDVRVTKGDKNLGCTQSHIPSFSLLEPEPSSPALPPLASSCQYITARPQRHVPGGRHDCHVPQRSTLYELLLISCWSYWLSEF